MKIAIATLAMIAFLYTWAEPYMNPGPTPEEIIVRELARTGPRHNQVASVEITNVSSPETRKD